MRQTSLKLKFKITIKILVLTNAFDTIIRVTFLARGFTIASTVSCLIKSRGKEVDVETLIVYTWRTSMDTYFSLPISQFYNGSPAFIIYNKTKYINIKFSKLLFAMIKKTKIGVFLV